MKSTIDIKPISVNMSANASTLKDNSEVPFERSISIRAKDQLQPPYPQTLKLSQPPGEGGKSLQTNASAQSYTGRTRRSSSGTSASQPTTYLSVGRAWGKTAQGNKRSSSVGYSPTSNWEHGSPLDEPWNGVREVAAVVNNGERSIRSPQSENHSPENDSDRATKGSSK